MVAHCNTRLHSLLKTVLGKIGDSYQAYCTTYKMHAMATCHGGTGHSLDRDLDILTEDPEHADINNDSTHSSNATVALGGPEAVGQPEDPVYNNQDRLTALMREINNLCQRVAAGEGQPAETLDHIQHELQNLLIAIHQPHPPASAEPLGEKIQQYTDTLLPCRNSQISQTPYCKINMFLLNIILPSWKIGSLILRQQQTSPVRVEHSLLK